MSEPYVVNSSDETQVAQARKQQRFDGNQELRDLHEILQLKAGRRFLWKLISDCKVFKCDYQSNPNAMYFDEGKRFMGLHLITMVNTAAPEAYTLMAKESNEGTKR